jgi:hypothetical protein
MWTLNFWKDVAERALKTAAQAVILGIGLAEGANLFEMDWRAALGFAAGGAVLSFLTSVASAPFGTKGTASLETEVDYK